MELSFLRVQRPLVRSGKIEYQLARPAPNFSQVRRDVLPPDRLGTEPTFFSASAVGLVGSLTKDEILFQAGDFVIGFELGLSVHQTVCREASPASGLGVRSRCVDFCPIMGGSRAEGVRGRIFANSERKFSFDPAIRIIHCRLDG